MRGGGKTFVRGPGSGGRSGRFYMNVGVRGVFFRGTASQKWLFIGVHAQLGLQ
jgi:hypothetical protein